MKIASLAILGSLLIPTSFVAGVAMAQDASTTTQQAAPPGFVMNGWGRVETEITRASLTVVVESLRRKDQLNFDIDSTCASGPEAKAMGEKILQEVLTAINGLASQRSGQGAGDSIRVELAGFDGQVRFYPRITVELRVPKIDDLPVLCRSLSAIPQARITQIDVSSTQPGADRLAAISAAADDARKDAAAYAQALGIRLTKLRRVQVQTGGSSYSEGPVDEVWNEWRQLQTSDALLSRASIPDNVPRKMATVSLVLFEYDIDDDTPLPSIPSEEKKTKSPN